MMAGNIEAALGHPFDARAYADPPALAAALELAEAGKPVFPANPADKSPRILRGLLAASTDPDTLRAWGARWQGAAVGMRTGAASGVWVLDVDKKRGLDGDEALFALQAEHGPLPEPFEVLTPSGGRHLYFQHPGHTVRTCSGLRPGLDVRGDKGYVLVPPSPGYEYEGSNPPVPPVAPEWLLELVREDEARPTAPALAPSDPIPDGRRNDALTRLAGRYRADGMSPAVLEALLLTINTERCRPPLPDAEVRQIAASVGRYTLERDVVGESSVDFSGLLMSAMGVPVTTWPAPLDMRELALVEPTPPEFFVADWMPKGYATLLAGHGGVGKSGIALHLACCLALGRDWWGLPTEPARVLYLSCEDREAVLHWRLARIAYHLGVTLDALHGRLLALDLVGHDVTLWRERGGPTPALGSLRDNMREADVLIVDGISDTYSGNENDRASVKSYVNALLSTVRDDGAVLLLGHVNRTTAAGGGTSEGYSGSTGWNNAVRARWYLYPETQAVDGEHEASGDLLLDHQKSNLGTTGAQVRFRWDDDAHLFLGQAVTPAGAADKAARDRRELDGIEEAIRAVIERGDYVPATRQGPDTGFKKLLDEPAMPSSLRADNRATRARFWRHVELSEVRLHGTTVSLPEHGVVVPLVEGVYRVVSTTNSDGVMLVGFLRE
ncbi:MAG: AAA family ATPase [Gammaproteobacteria bacterium]|nr:AAA family ATPase [Gammaproteobacteria bacterium]